MLTYFHSLVSSFIRLANSFLFSSREAFRTYSNPRVRGLYSARYFAYVLEILLRYPELNYVVVVTNLLNFRLFPTSDQPVDGGEQPLDAESNPVDGNLHFIRRVIFLLVIT